MAKNRELSKAYLEEALSLAKEYMPRWAFAILQSKARAQAGGKSANRSIAPTFLEKLALPMLTEELLSGVGADELRQVWQRINQLFGNAQRKKEPLQDLTSAGRFVLGELVRREIAVKPCALTRALEPEPTPEPAHEPDGAHQHEVVLPDGERLFTELDGQHHHHEVEAPTAGPPGAKIAFVGASLSRTDQARREPFVGAPGKTLKSEYLEPLGLRREDVVLTNVVPRMLTNQQGDVREPTHREVVDWQDWLTNELEEKHPQIIVGLGRTAKHALGGLADFSLPHPSAVTRRGRPESLVRKLKAIKKALRTDQPIKDKLLKRRAIGKQQQLGPEGDEGSPEAQQQWEQGWENQLPRTGGGRFVYQLHFRGLSEQEAELSLEELLQTDHSLHADLRLDGPGGAWGFAIVGDRKSLDGFGVQDTDLKAIPKPQHSEAWLDVGEPPTVIEPGGPGASPQTFAKLFRKDQGRYGLGVASQDQIELVLDGNQLIGRYVLQFDPAPEKKVWLISKPNNQTPTAETNQTPDRLIRELRGKRQRFLFFGDPGKVPRVIDLKTGKDVTQKRISICKADETKQILYAVAIDPYTFGDAHNDWVPPKDVEATAHRWMKESRVIGRNHSRKADADTFPVETWLVQYPSEDDYKKAMAGKPHRAYRMPFGNQVVHSGSWIVGTHLGDPDWAAYQRGDIGEYSIGAFGFRTPIGEAALPDVTFIDLVEQPSADKPTI